MPAAPAWLPDRSHDTLATLVVEAPHSHADRIEIDVSLWPIVRCTPHGRPRDEDWERMFRDFEKLWRRGERFLTITDTRFSQNGSAKQRQRIGEWIRDNNDSARHCTIGSITIVESVIVRGALTAINWIAQPDYPMEYVKDWVHAVLFASRWLDQGGLLTDKVRLHLSKIG